MNRLIKARRSIVYVSIIMALLLGSCARPGIQLPTPTPVPPPGSQALLGDFGDAPDGDYNMDTGYYAFTGGPWVWTLSSAGVPAKFPTMGRDQVPGPYMLDVDEFWIGPLLTFSDDSDIPSIEDDADDLNDPDGLANILVNGTNADCDQENGSHNPAGNGCAPMAAYSMPMNARLLIFFGVPPLGIWITTIHASEDMSYNGPVYWNLLYDLDQDGDWEDGPEWVARDILVDLEPGERETLISPAFRFPTSGTPWGRLRFPNWVRSMISSESMEDTFNGQHWDGRGIEGGFEVGEVEDYFVEWRPIGQRFPNQGGGGGAGAGEGPLCQLTSDDMLEKLPPTRGMEDVLTFMPGENVTELEFITTDFEIDVGGVDQSVSATVGEDFCDDQTGCFSCEPESGYCIFEIPGTVQDDETPRTVMVYPRRLLTECSGTGRVGVSPAIYGTYHPKTGETVVWGGLFGFELVAIIDKAGHLKFIGMPGQFIADVILSSITVKGPHPWVEVSGDFDEATGEFSAEGTGTVAGFPNIKVTFTGTLGVDTISGEYTMGADGGLPQGEPIVYSVEGSRVEEPAGETPVETGPIPLAPGVEEAIQSFVDVFNGAFESGDPEPLYQLLHPAVGEIYGEEACLAYIEGIVSTPTNLEYQDASYVGKWEFERDGVVVPVDFAYSVMANFTANDQSSQQELHLVLPGDDSVRWFTDCGEPLGSQ